jgi:hypothetical protein
MRPPGCAGAFALSGTTIAEELFVTKGKTHAKGKLEPVFRR